MVFVAEGARSMSSKHKDRLLDFAYRWGHLRGLEPPTEGVPDEEIIQSFTDLTAALVARFESGFRDGRNDAEDDVIDAHARERYRALHEHVPQLHMRQR
jgi:hypothetical protein